MNERGSMLLPAALTALAVMGGLVLMLMGGALLAGRLLPADIIAYVRPTRLGTHIYLADVAHTLATPVTRGDGGYLGPAWSPDGEQIAYLGPADGGYALFVQSFGTGGAHIATAASSLAASGSPAWSPDGRSLVYGSVEPPGYPGLFITSVDGSAAAPVRRITPDTGGAFYPTWSPDGTWIAFSWSPVANSEIWRVAVSDDGGGAILASTALAQPQRMTFDYRADSAPRYSPDGAWIAFESGRDNNTEIYLMPAHPVPVDGASPGIIEAQAEIGLINLTRSPQREYAPTWSADGRRVALLQADGTRTRLLVVSIDRPGVLTPLLTLEPYYGSPAWRP